MSAMPAFYHGRMKNPAGLAGAGGGHDYGRSRKFDQAMCVFSSPSQRLTVRVVDERF